MLMGGSDCSATASDQEDEAGDLGAPFLRSSPRSTERVRVHFDGLDGTLGLEKAFSTSLDVCCSLGCSVS